MAIQTAFQVEGSNTHEQCGKLSKAVHQKVSLIASSRWVRWELRIPTESQIRGMAMVENQATSDKSHVYITGIPQLFYCEERSKYEGRCHSFLLIQVKKKSRNSHTSIQGLQQSTGIQQGCCAGIREKKHNETLST